MTKSYRPLITLVITFLLLIGLLLGVRLILQRQLFKQQAAPPGEQITVSLAAPTSPLEPNQTYQVPINLSAQNTPGTLGITGVKLVFTYSGTSIPLPPFLTDQLAGWSFRDASIDTQARTITYEAYYNEFGSPTGYLIELQPNQTVVFGSMNFQFTSTGDYSLALNPSQSEIRAKYDNTNILSELAPAFILTIAPPCPNSYGTCPTPTGAINPTPTPSATYCLPASEDAYATSNTPTTNYGWSSNIWAGMGNYSYLKFNAGFPPAPASIQSVKLRLRIDSATSFFNNGSSIHVARVTSPWSESSLTYTNRPTIDASTLAVLTLGLPFTPDTEIDITNVYTSGSIANGLSVQCVPSASQPDCTIGAQTLLNYSSKEGAIAPQLCFTYSGPPPVTATPAPPTPTNQVPSATPTATPTRIPSPTPTSPPWFTEDGTHCVRNESTSGYDLFYSEPNCQGVTYYHPAVGSCSANGSGTCYHFPGNPSAFVQSRRTTATSACEAYIPTQLTDATELLTQCYYNGIIPTPTPTIYSDGVTLNLTTRFQEVFALATDPSQRTQTITVELQQVDGTVGVGSNLAFTQNSNGTFSSTFDQTIPPGNYSIRLKATNHLGSTFGPIILGFGINNIDLTNQFLRAGDLTSEDLTPNSSDNVLSPEDLNAMISVRTAPFLPASSNPIYDLNLDGTINADDLNIIITNRTQRRIVGD